jgi:CIC family chloride channel protein
LQGSETIANVRKSLAQYSGMEASSILLIHCGDGFWYAATYEELQGIFANPSDIDPEPSLEERLGKERTPILFPDLPLSSTLPHFKRWPLLPITNRAMRGALEGTISLADALKRYQGR